MPDLLRETFEAYALRAPSADGLREAVDARVRRGRRRRWTVVSAAAATAAVVVAGTLLVGGGPGTTEPAPDRTGQRTPLVTEPPVSDGMAWVGWRGVEVRVPEEWLHAAYGSCGVPVTDAVVVDASIVLGQCAPYRSPTVSTVEFVAREDYTIESLTEVRDVVVSGVPARRHSGRTPPRWSGETRTLIHGEALVVLDRDLAIYVASPDPALARRVLDTARIAPERDSYGCAVRRDTWWPQAPPAREGADARMVPGTPVQASVCRYATRNGWVHKSALVVDGVDDLARAINGMEAPDPDPNPPGEGTSIVVTFRYAEGPDVEVFLWKLQDGPERASNGAVGALVSGDVREAIRPLVGWRYDFDDQRDLTRVGPGS